MKAKFLKSPILHFSLLAALTGGIVSCGNSDGARTNADTKEVAEDKNDAKFDSAKMEKDAQFLVNAAEINLEEIKLGQLAQQKGMSNDIKTLGQKMVETHTKAINHLKTLAQSKNISIHHKKNLEKKWVRPKPRRLATLRAWFKAKPFLSLTVQQKMLTMHGTSCRIQREMISTRNIVT